MKIFVCKCNMCGDYYEDCNPQVNQKQYEVLGLEPLEKVFVEISKPELDYWACPKCLTDSYLQDFNGEIEENWDLQGMTYIFRDEE